MDSGSPWRGRVPFGVPDQRVWTGGVVGCRRVRESRPKTIRATDLWLRDRAVRGGERRLRSPSARVRVTWSLGPAGPHPHASRVPVNWVSHRPVETSSQVGTGTPRPLPALSEKTSRKFLLEHEKTLAARVWNPTREQTVSRLRDRHGGARRRRPTAAGGRTALAPTTTGKRRASRRDPPGVHTDVRARGTNRSGSETLNDGCKNDAS